MARNRKDRFHNVLRTIGYNQAQKDYYINYLRGLNDVPELTGDGVTRGNKVPLYVEPFSLPLAVDTIAKESAYADAWTAIGTVAPIPTYTKAATGGKEIFDSVGYSAPRVSRKILGAKTIQRSKFTNKQRRVRTGESISVPFGRNAIGDTVLSVYTSIATALKAGNPNVRTTLIPERF